MSTSITGYERALLDPTNANKSKSITDLIRSNASGTDVQKASLSVSDLYARDVSLPGKKKSKSDAAYEMTPTPPKTTLVDRAMADFVAGGVPVSTTTPFLGFRKSQ